MKYSIHLKNSPESAEAVIEHLKIVKYLRRKDIKAELCVGRPIIKFEVNQPGIITHLKKQFDDQILCVLSNKHGEGQYRRPSQHVTAGAAPTALIPSQVAKAYNFPAPGPTIKQKVVAIIELGGGYNPSDVLTYCKQQNIAMPRLWGHNIDTGSNSPDGPEGADGEVSLDIDVVTAIAPGCQILVVFAPNTTNGIIDAIANMSNYVLKPDVVSNSWGMPEGDWDPAVMQAINNAIKSCVDKGINFIAAAGDDGSSDGAKGKNVDFPASSPYAISCGGTRLILNPDGTRQSEVVWNDLKKGEGATGGGISAEQVADPIQGNALGVELRHSPDISGNADPESGYIVDVDGNISSIGGTSAVAPLYAGLAVLLASNLDEPLPDLRKVLYANPNVCFDVVSGNNGAYSAGPGYDCCSGLGVVDGMKLLNVLKPTATQKVMKFLKQPIGDLLRNISR